jgi:hypothetical protein
MPPEDYYMTSEEIDNKLNDLLSEMNEWIRDEREKFIAMNIEEIERKASDWRTLDELEHGHLISGVLCPIIPSTTQTNQ